MPNAFLNKLINNSKVDQTLYKQTDSHRNYTFIKGENDTILGLQHNSGSNSSSAGLPAYLYSSLQDCVDGSHDENISNIFYSDVSHNTLTTKIVNKCYNNIYNDMYEQDADGTKNFFGIDRNKITEFGQSQSTVDSYALMSGDNVTPNLHFVLNCCEEPLLIQPLRKMPNANITPVIFGTNNTMTSSGFVPYSVKGSTIDETKNMWLNNKTLANDTLNLYMYNMNPTTFKYRCDGTSIQYFSTFWMANDIWNASINNDIDVKYAFLKPSFFSKRYYDLSADGISQNKSNYPTMSLDCTLLTDRTSSSGSRIIFCQNMENFHPITQLISTTAYSESTSSYESLLAMSIHNGQNNSNMDTQYDGILNRMNSYENTFYKNMYNFLTDKCDRRRHSKYNAKRLIYTSNKQPVQTTRLTTYQQGYERNPRLSIAYGTSSSDGYSVYQPDKILPELASFYANNNSIFGNSTPSFEQTITSVGSYAMQLKLTALTNPLNISTTNITDYSSVVSSNSSYFYIKKLIDYYGHNFISKEVGPSIYKLNKFLGMIPATYRLATYIYTDVTRVLPKHLNNNIIYLKTRNIITIDFTKGKYIPVCNDQRLYEMIKSNGNNLLPLFTRKKMYNRMYYNNINHENAAAISSYDLKSGGKLMDFHYIRPDLLYKLNTYGYPNASKLAYTYDFGY